MTDSYVAALGDGSLFPDLKASAYLHYAAIAPPSLAVRAAVKEVLDSYAELGAGAYDRWQSQRDRLRPKLESLIGGEAGSVALTANTSRGVSDIALCVPWRAGDRVVVFKGEFPTNVTPWQSAAPLFGLELLWHDAADFAGDATIGLQKLEQALKGGVRLVAASAVQFQTGLRMPLVAIGALCRKYDAELFADGIQACGVVPLDVKAANISYLSSGAHKWLMGTEGAGFLYVAPDAASRLKPYVAGWLSHEDPVEFLFKGAGHLRYDRPLKSSALVFELGTLNLLGLAALEASVDLIASLGTSAIFAHVSAYLDRLETGLISRGFSSFRERNGEARSAILGVLPPPGLELDELHRGLFQRGIVCGKPDGVLRFAPHWPNAQTEVDAILAVVDEIRKTRRA
jgi:selenocysteine lyase/cysteine desulfurase